MKAYIYKAALLCEPCALLERGRILARPFVGSIEAHPSNTGDSDDYPQGPFENGGGEADSPQHCDKCNAFLQNPLTPDGLEYVRDQLEQYRLQGNRALIQWWNYYRDALGKVELAP